ncbi:MAG: type I polyketide synthase, partial [bacterium]|nr:type I polyketide synthase [bacterium]
MPFCVLLEVGLQPCGWLAAYLGSALRSETDMSFRNLDGRAVLHEEVFPDAGTLRTRVRMTHVSEAGGMIIEKFDFQILREGRMVYGGETAFGFFSAEALAKQVGIRDARARVYVPTEQAPAFGRRFMLDEIAPFTPDDRGGRVEPCAAMPARALQMVDEIEVLDGDGGPHGLGYVRGSATVDPDAWFFKAHFYQDPVWPGSLGLESFLQLLKVYALDRWGGDGSGSTRRFEPIALESEHRWSYRGQITLPNKRVEV